MVLLAQCAPQCAPAPSPPSASYADVTDAVPGTGITRDISPDGRFVSYGGFGQAIRLDLNDRSSATSPGAGLMVGESWGVVDAESATSVGLYDFSTHALLRHAGLPSGWTLDSIDSTSSDGLHVGVSAVNAGFSGQSAFVLDLATGTATQLDLPLGGGSFATASWGALVSADGSTATFSHRDAPVGCGACVDTWAWRGGSTVLVSPSTSGGPSTTGDSQPVDVSSDGRFVLFLSTAVDLGAGPTDPASPQGRLFVRDLVAGNTAVVPPAVTVVGDASAAAISDDGNKVAFATDRPVTLPGGAVVQGTFAVLYDRATSLMADLTPVDADHQLWSPTRLGMSASGRRVAFDVVAAAGERHAVVDVTY
jgi:hypothetical protein